MTPNDLLSPTYLQMLGVLSAWLEKGATQLAGDKADALPAARLAPDMFPLSTQIRFACVQALEGMHRLRGEEFPPLVSEMLDEGRHAGDAPGTLAEAQSRIAQTIAMVETLSADAPQRDESEMIAHALPTGMVFDMTLGQYARDWALGQFYFHVMTAYAILRSAGVDIGKADYVAHLFPLIRPGAMPTR